MASGGDMTLSADKFVDKKKRLRAVLTAGLPAGLAQLDAIIMTVARGAWRAAIDGLAIYGMTECSAIIELYEHQILHSPGQLDAASMTYLASRMPRFDGVGDGVDRRDHR
jgi:hypothetical protein